MNKLVLSLITSASIVSSASAISLNFDVATDYEDNFWGPSNRTLSSWDASGDITKAIPSSTNTLVFNSNAIGGGSNLAGTAAGVPLDKFDNFVYQVDVSMSVFSTGNSFGFYTKLNDAANSGDLAIFRFSNGSSADFRMYVGGNPTSGNGLGSNTTPVTTQTFAPTSNFTTDTYYTFRLEVEDVGNDVEYRASIWTTGVSPTQIGSTLNYTYTDGNIGLGQVGLRLSASNGSSGSLRFDNYQINAIPEPAYLATMLCGFISLVAILRRRKK